MRLKVTEKRSDIERHLLSSLGAGPLGPPIPLLVAKYTLSPTTKNMRCTPEEREVGPPFPNSVFASRPCSRIGFIP